MSLGSDSGEPFRYSTGGSMEAADPSYVERHCDRDLLRFLLKGEFCYILTARQMGKSSLMIRTAKRMEQAGWSAVVCDLTAIGQTIKAEQWYDGMCWRLGQQLDREDELEEFWLSQTRLEPLTRLLEAIRKILLSTDQSIVIFIDEIDVVRSLDFVTDEFFAAIRSCYNRRDRDPEFKRLTFCMLGVATPSDLIRNPTLTPFNVGRRIELHDFTKEEAMPLAQGLKGMDCSVKDAERLLCRILYWTNGHPYLTQRFCELVADRKNFGGQGASRLIDPVCEEDFLSNKGRLDDDNLVFVRERLLKAEVDRIKLLHYYEQIWRGRKVREDESNPYTSVLRLSGIVRPDNGHLVMRNRIYSSVFDLTWIRDNLPDAEQKRVAAAFRRGVIFATVIATVVIAAMTVMIFIASDQRNKAQAALSESFIAQAASSFSQAQAMSVSGLSGQRFKSIDALVQAKTHYTNIAALRDQVISCLALVDVEKRTSPVSPPTGATASALNYGLTHQGWADAQGAISVVRLSDTNITLTIPSVGQEVSWIAVSPGGHYVAAQYDSPPEPLFRIWDGATGEEILILTNRVLRTAVDFSRDVKRVAVGVPRDGIHLFSLPDGERIDQLQRDEPTSVARNPACVRFAPDGRYVAESALNSLTLAIWNVSERSSTNLYHGAPVVAIAWSSDGQQLAAATATHTLYQWDVGMFRRRLLKEAHTDLIVDLAFSPHGHVLASAAKDMTLKLWVPATGRPVTEILPGEPSGRLFFNDDGAEIGLSNRESGTLFWAVEGSKEYQVFRPLEEVLAPITDVTFGIEGKVLVVANNVGVFLWDTMTWKSLPSLDVRSVRSLAVDPVDGDLLVNSPDEFRVFPVDTTDPKRSYGPSKWLSIGAGLGGLAVSPDGQRAAIIRGDRIVIIHLDDPVATQVDLGVGIFDEVAWSADGRWLAVWSPRDDFIQVWEVVDGANPSEPVAKIPGSRYFEFSPDSRYLLTTWDRQCEFWRTDGWIKESASIVRPSFGNPVGPLAIAATSGVGNCFVAVADAPGIIKLYEIQTAPALKIGARATLRSPYRATLIGLVFNQDASHLAAPTAEDSVHVWDLGAVRKVLDSIGLDHGLPVY